LTTLSGCAQSTQNLLNCKCWQEDKAANKQQQQRPGLYAAEESEIFPPQRPAGVEPLPPGRRVPEYLQPPPVLPPLKLNRYDLCPPIQPPPVQPEKAPDDPALVIALRMLLSKQPDKALPYLEHYDRATQEVFIRLLPTLALLDEKSIDQLSASEADKLQEQLEGALVPLRRRAELTIAKMCLCESFEGLGFGRITPKRDGYIFQAGEILPIYIEVCNTTCQLRDGYYVTHINGTASIYDQSGQRVAFHDYRLREPPMKSLLPHYDCWRPYAVNLPMHMPAGKYLLTVEITDRTLPTARTARKSVEIVVR
jgi:hypothetical protein